jgi:hypothetical protein
MFPSSGEETVFCWEYEPMDEVQTPSNFNCSILSSELCSVPFFLIAYNIKPDPLTYASRDTSSVAW